MRTHTWWYSDRHKLKNSEDMREMRVFSLVGDSVATKRLSGETHTEERKYGKQKEVL